MEAESEAGAIGRVPFEQHFHFHSFTALSGIWERAYANPGYGPLRDITRSRHDVPSRLGLGLGSRRLTSDVWSVVCGLFVCPRLFGLWRALARGRVSAQRTGNTLVPTAVLCVTIHLLSSLRSRRITSN